MLGSGVSTVNKRNLAFARTEGKVYLRTRNSRCDGWDERISPRCYENVDHGGLSLSWRSKENFPEEMTLKDRLKEDLRVGVPHSILFANKVSLL